MVRGRGGGLKFKSRVLENAEEVRGVVNVGRKWKRSEWWDACSCTKKEKEMVQGKMKQNELESEAVSCEQMNNLVKGCRSTTRGISSCFGKR